MGQQYAEPLNEEEKTPTVKVCDFTTAYLLPEDPSQDFKVSLKAGTVPFNSPE